MQGYFGLRTGWFRPGIKTPARHTLRSPLPKFFAFQYCQPRTVMQDSRLGKVIELALVHLCTLIKLLNIKTTSGFASNLSRFQKRMVESGTNQY